MDERKKHSISRREFARHAVLASAAASLAPGAVLPRNARESEFQAQSAAPSTTGQAQQPANLPKLSPEGQAEAETRVQTIFSRYGSRFSDAQKADIRRLCFLAQPPLDRLRAYALTNGDGPALYLKPVVEREKKPATAGKSATAKKS
ncbi:MAG: hypothetical protein PVS2B2_13390 [Candidatus Acidiferrum sp.]